MSRALQINSSPQGWMARNTKPVPLAEKGWVITMKKMSIILLSAVLVFSMAACNGGKEKADNQTEKQTESVKPTEEVAMATEAVTEVTTEAGSEETEKDIAEAKDSEEKTDKEDNRSADNETASKQEEKPKQNDEPEQKAPVNDNEEAGGNQSNVGNGGQTTDSPKDNVSNPQPASVAYSPQNVVSLATAKCQAGGMITTQQNLQNHLNDGSITQEEYNEYYPYDGMEGSYYSVFVETDLNKASTIDGQRLSSEDAIAEYIALGIYQNDLEASKTEYDKPFAYSKELEEKLARQCELNAQLDLENAKAVDADLSGPEEEREADDRMEAAAIVAEDKGAYPADREGRTR